MNPTEELAFISHKFGITLPGAIGFAQDGWSRDFKMACDAQPSLITVPNAGIPAYLTNFIDPNILRILTAKNAGAEILGEQKKGSFVDVTVTFPVVEHTGEVSSYGDFSSDGKSGANTAFPQREAYLYQTVVEYGNLESERAGLAKLGWANELKQSAVTVLNKFQNLTYFYGVAGLQNYGLLNDPSLSAPLTPATKAAGGATWINGAAINGTANEIYADIQALFIQLVNQSGGLIDQDSALTLALSPKSSGALTATNQYNVNVEDLLKKNFKNLKVKTAIQYGALTAQNPQGSSAGEIVQLIASDVQGQDSGYCAFNEKLRADIIVPAMSSFRQKFSQGSWGAIIRQPYAISQMVGV